jgi:tRNA(Ile)-lysidine synthase TilS/MesJ
LPETFPGIRFNENGECNFCSRFSQKDRPEGKKEEYFRRFQELIEEHRDKNDYDALLSYSGGKDSTYVLWWLKKFRLNILALTFDHGFLPERTHDNIRIVTESLGVDHIIFKPNFNLLRRIFVRCSQETVFAPATLIRASQICTACMAMVKANCLKVAVEKTIPFIVYGWSPGQIPLASSVVKSNPRMSRLMQTTLLKPIQLRPDDELRTLFLNERLSRKSNLFPYLVSPLAFSEYDEQKVLRQVKSLGWKQPTALDSNSTNCLLNSFANIVHKAKHGFHPYSFELAKLVREGYLKRSEALSRLSRPEDKKTVTAVRKKLGFASDSAKG